MRKIIRSEMSYSEPVSFDLEVYTMLKREDLDYLEKEIASLKEQLEESSSLVKDSFEIICMTCTKRSNIDNRIKVQAWLKKARVTQARREK